MSIILNFLLKACINNAINTEIYYKVILWRGGVQYLSFWECQELENSLILNTHFLRVFYCSSPSKCSILCWKEHFNGIKSNSPIIWSEIRVHWLFNCYFVSWEKTKLSQYTWMNLHLDQCTRWMHSLLYLISANRVQSGHKAFFVCNTISHTQVFHFLYR